MTTFQIPEGKVVDRIELEAGEGKATLNIIYKEDMPKEKKRAVVLCETKKFTGIFLSNLTGELVACGRSERPDPTYYVPMEKAEAGEFVVVPRVAFNESMAKVDKAAWELSDSFRLKELSPETKAAAKKIYDGISDIQSLLIAGQVK